MLGFIHFAVWTYDDPHWSFHVRRWSIIVNAGHYRIALWWSN